MISGGCARPIDDPVHRTGAKPALSRQDAESARAAIERRMESEIEARLAPQIASRPVAAQPGAPQIVSPAITSEALLAYQQTMQQFLALQERVVSQFLNGAAPATAEVRLAAPATLAHPAAPATVATGVSQAPVTPVAATPPVAPAAPIAVFDPRTLLVAIVSERTGYPQEMLDLDADLEADLGIDSIKRVEILGALRKGLPETMASAAQGRMEKLTRTRSLRAILAELATFAPAPGPAVEPAAAPALAPAAVAEIAFDLRAALLSVVAERTGYPAEMLGMDADLEADLGIDSIKRVEILGAFRKQLPEALSASLAGGMEKLTRARSLGAILGLLPSTVESATVGAPPSAPAAMAAPVPAAAVAVDTAPIRELLLRVVAERTGYPAEMLGMDADLEADLGIDSIKRVEILGALKSQVDATNAAAMSARMEKLTRARSLSKILAELAEAPAAPAPAPAMTVGEPAANDAASTIAEDALPRYVVKSTRLQTPEPAASGFAGPVLVLGPADALITRVMRELGLRKLNAVHVTETDGSALREAIDAMRKQHGAVRGLLHLHGMMPAPAATLVQWRSLYQRDLTSLLHAVQATLDDVPQMRLIAASRLGGTFGRDAVGDGGPVAGGANGLLNCLRAEFPSVRARAVDFDGQSDAEIATLLLDELLAESSEPEAGYIGIERFGSCTIEEPLVPNPFPEPVEPAADWVLLATGGARGITAEIIEELCVPGMRLVLLGRTPEPAAEDLALSARGSEDEVRKYLLAASLARGEKPRPVEIDRAVARVMTDREVRANLRRLRATGATVDYVPCDVRDDAAFGSLIDRLYERFGRIDAVIHGAGVIEDKRLGDKSVESFERVLGTKLDPAFVLASRLRPASLKLLAFFTSVAGRFGNLGQGDYAAANEALNRLAWDLHRRWTHTRVISINWGPWDAGMASEGVKRGLRERGMEPIPVKAGRRFFREELAHGPKHEVELVAGRGPWGRRANETAPAPWTLDDVGMDAGGVLVGRMQLRADGVADDSQTLVAAMKRLVAIGWRGWTVSDIRELRMPAQPLASGQLRARAASHSEPEEQAVTVELTGPGSREVLARATVILRQGHASAIAAPGGP
jgi:NAD(P)-dependent dehydrogenase (short-subunit alcohol dehydrogenase family)/acyl carrier protein